MVELSFWITRILKSDQWPLSTIFASRWSVKVGIVYGYLQLYVQDFRITAAMLSYIPCQLKIPYTTTLKQIFKFRIIFPGASQLTSCACKRFTIDICFTVIIYNDGKWVERVHSQNESTWNDVDETTIDMDKNPLGILQL